MTAADVRRLFRALAARFEAERERLGALDARVGDGDHGAAMARGFAAAARAVEADGGVTPGDLLETGGHAFMRTTGGASGPLVASLFLKLGVAAEGADRIGGAQVASGLREAARLVGRMGRSEAGDKTLLDALEPAAAAAGSALEEGRGDATVLVAARDAARDGAEATRVLRARRGRAHWVEGGGEGHVDPGAVSVALVLEVLHAVARGEAADDAPLPRPADEAEAAPRERRAGAATKLLNAPEDAVEEMLDGYVAAYGDVVACLPGRPVVVRRTPKPVGRVGLAIGNGSGHEPVAAGWVGEGMLDANALGEIFTAPPPDLIRDAILAAERGAGVLLLISQHAGDVINGEMGAELARDAGSEVAVLRMYDDVASAPQGRESERRGAPGTTFVYKIVGARAEEGAPLAELLELGERVRDATRTLSVAARPGTSPITGEPMFELPEGELFIGMGVHGEPGFRRMPAGAVDDVVRAMLDGILEDGPFARGDRVLAFVNGAGGTTLMELLIAYRALDRQLAERGVAVHRPLVGEYVTTQETGGFSISLCRADDELRRLWDAPARAPFFHRP